MSGGPNGTWGPIDANYRPLRNRDNNYLTDRKKQRTESFTGIEGDPLRLMLLGKKLIALCDER